MGPTFAIGYSLWRLCIAPAPQAGFSIGSRFTGGRAGYQPVTSSSASSRIVRQRLRSAAESFSPSSVRSNALEERAYAGFFRGDRDKAASTLRRHLDAMSRYIETAEAAFLAARHHAHGHLQ